MKRDFIILSTSLMLIGLLGTASMSLGAGTWTRKADMPTGRFLPGSAVVDGKIYVIGGAPVDYGITAVVEEYDPAADTWTRRADMPTARQGVRAAAVDGIIYAIGGWESYADVGWGSSVEAYDPATDTWTRKADMPTARRHAAACVIDGRTMSLVGAQELTFSPLPYQLWKSTTRSQTSGLKHSICPGAGLVIPPVQ